MAQVMYKMWQIQVINKFATRQHRNKKGNTSVSLTPPLRILTAAVHFQMVKLALLFFPSGSSHFDLEL